VLVLVVRRENRIDMDRSDMYLRLLDMAIQLCDFLSDIKHPEHVDMLGKTTALLLNERRGAIEDHRRYMFERNERMCAAIEQRKIELNLAKLGTVEDMINERNKQIADGTLAEDEIDNMSEQDSDDETTEESSTQYDSDSSMITHGKSSEDESDSDNDDCQEYVDNGTMDNCVTDELSQHTSTKLAIDISSSDDDVEFTQYA